MTAPQVTYEQVQAAIVREQYRVLDDGRTTLCQLTMDNGFTVIATSASATVENFREQVGREVSRKNAEDKVWELLGFRLRDQLAASPVYVAYTDPNEYEKAIAECEPGQVVSIADQPHATASAALGLIRSLGAGHGRLVCTGDLDNGQITVAHTMSSFFVDDKTGMGYVIWPWELTTSQDHQREARLSAARKARADASAALHAAKMDT